MVNNMAESRPAKVVVLGSNGVGKTALVVRCLTRRFLPEYAPSTETSYKHKIKRGGKEMEMLIVDSNGQNNDIYSQTEAFVLVYSVTSKKSLETIRTYAKRIGIMCKNNPMVLLVANQIDLIQSREVSYIEGSRLANEIGAEYFEISVANEIDSVIGIFNNLCQKINIDTNSHKVSRNDLDAVESKRRKTQKLINYFMRRGST